MELLPIKSIELPSPIFCINHVIHRKVMKKFLFFIDFKGSRSALKEFMNHMNEKQIAEDGKKDLTKHLRHIHQAVAEKLIYLAIQQHISKLNTFKANKSLVRTDPTKHVEIVTNRRELRNLFDKRYSLATMSRAIDRLIDRGVLKERISHGPCHNFQLRINPQVLAIYNLETAQHVPTGKFSKRSQSAINQILKTKCKPFNKETESINNKISSLKTVDKVTGQSPERNCEKQVHDKRQEPEKFTKPAVEIASIPKENSFEKKKKELAVKLVTFMFTILFSFRKLWEDEEEVCRKIMVDSYLSGCKNEKELEETAKKIEWSIQAVKRNRKKHKMFTPKTWTIAPRKFLSPGRLSLVNVMNKWYENNQKRRAYDKVDEKPFDEEQAETYLFEIKRFLFANPNIRSAKRIVELSNKAQAYLKEKFSAEYYFRLRDFAANPLAITALKQSNFRDNPNNEVINEVFKVVSTTQKGVTEHLEQQTFDKQFDALAKKLRNRKVAINPKYQPLFKLTVAGIIPRNRDEQTFKLMNYYTKL